VTLLDFVDGEDKTRVREDLRDYDNYSSRPYCQVLLVFDAAISFAAAATLSAASLAFSG
jgi:hypothetical protein